MYFSYNWLRELVERVDQDAATLGKLITMKTAECEGVQAVGRHFEQVCAARVVSVEPIDGSRNVRAVVDTGRGVHRNVVCGAPNCRNGITTAYVPPGTRIGDREIQTATISGAMSEGMLASGAELGINRDSAGILEVALEPGESLALQPDFVIEIDNKSLTHRPDLWGHFGMAREVAAITGTALGDPVHMDRLPAGDSALDVAIADLTLCPRYNAILLENVAVGPSPLWLQYRLQTLGLNPINNIVDVTNLVMVELAQPMHAFDADRLSGSRISVRPAAAGEVLRALNDQEYILKPSHLVIADAAGPVALAGVIGGEASAISSRTTRIVLESACFDSASVRRTSSDLRLRTDASMRFEKAQDPENTARGIIRAIDLLRDVSPGIRLSGGIAEQRQPMVDRAPIAVPLDWLDKKLGRALDDREVRNILEALGFGVQETAPRHLAVSAPTWRATKDVSIKEDILEEVGRMAGYDSFPPIAPVVPVTVPPLDERRTFLREVRDLTAAQGFHEIFNYSFVSEQDALRFAPNLDGHVRVQNPIAADQTLLRTSLLPGIWKNLSENRKHLDQFMFFEAGQSYHLAAGSEPREETQLAAAIYAREDGAPGLFSLKRLAECLAPDVRVRPAAARPFEHPARAAVVFAGDRELGRLFELHPSLLEGRGSVLEISLDQLAQLRRRSLRYKPMRRHPASEFDLSVIADLREPVGVSRDCLAAVRNPLIESIEFLRVYTGAPVPEGRKSVTFRVRVADATRTLEAAEANAVRDQLIAAVRSAGYELRM